MNQERRQTFKSNGASILVSSRAGFSLRGIPTGYTIVSFVLFIQEGFGITVCLELARNKAGMYQLYNCMVGFI